METTTNAADAYRAARERIDRQIGQINHLVRAHAERQSKTPADWGYPGDLDRVIDALGEAIEFLGGEKTK